MGPNVIQLYSTAHWGHIQDWTYSQVKEGLKPGIFLPPSQCHSWRMDPCDFALLSTKKASFWKRLQPLASSCSLWGKRSICFCSTEQNTRCIFAVEVSSVVHLKVKKFWAALLVIFCVSNLLCWFQESLQNVPCHSCVILDLIAGLFTYLNLFWSWYCAVDQPD